MKFIDFYSPNIRKISPSFLFDSAIKITIYTKPPPFYVLVQGPWGESMQKVVKIDQKWSKMVKNVSPEHSFTKANYVPKNIYLWFLSIMTIILMFSKLPNLTSNSFEFNYEYYYVFTLDLQTILKFCKIRKINSLIKSASFTGII